MSSARSQMTATRVLFGVSSALAKIIFVFVAIGALAAAFPDPESGQSVSGVYREISLGILVAIVTGVGTVFVSQRKLLGLLFFTPLLVAFLLYKNFIGAILFFIALAVMALPFLLVLIETLKSERRED